MPRHILLFLLTFITAAPLRADLYCNAPRGFGAFGAEHASDTTLLLSNSGPEELVIPLPLAPEYLNIRTVNHHSNPNKSYPAFTTSGTRVKVKYPGWGIRFTAGADTLSYSFSTVSIPDAFGEPQDRLKITITNGNHPSHTARNAESGRQKSRSESFLNSGVELFDGPNLLVFKHDGKNVSLRMGDSGKLKVLPAQSFPAPESAALFLSPGASLEILDMTIRPASVNEQASETISTEEIESILTRREEPLTGLYELYEFDIDNEKTILPDRLRLAILPDDVSQGDYSLVYISGYPDSDASWQPGMTKGHISSSPFKDYYYLEWISADRQILSKGCSLTSDALPLLHLQFPYQNVKFSLRRIPDPFPFIPRSHE